MNGCWPHPATMESTAGPKTIKATTTDTVNWKFCLKIGLTAAIASWLTLAGAETWRFALIGDVPYSDYERAELPKMLDDIAERHVEFVAHIGDFKNGKDRCDDAVFEDRLHLFDASRIPFVFVPGDNEWTDCSRKSNGAYDPLERLGKLRSLFWNTGRSLGRTKIALARQSEKTPEHARFRLGPVLFVSLNIPGGNNNWTKTGEPGPEYLARNPLALQWLKDSFALARQESLAGLVLLFQANPGFTNFSLGMPIPSYREFLEALREETIRFPGQVVAVHGDSHISRIDKPLRDKHGHQIANFIRVETFGYPVMGWIHGLIDSESPTLFRFETHPWLPGRL